MSFIGAVRAMPLVDKSERHLSTTNERREDVTYIKKKSETGRDDQNQVHSYRCVIQGEEALTDKLGSVKGLRISFTLSRSSSL